jgi:hypothetical protein
MDAITVDDFDSDELAVVKNAAHKKVGKAA